MVPPVLHKSVSTYLFEIEVEVVSVAVLQDSAERVGVDFEDVVEVDYPWVLEVLVDVVLPEGVLDVVGLLLVFPVLVQLVDLASHVPLLLHVETLQINTIAQRLDNNVLVPPCHTVVSLPYPIHLGGKNHGKTHSKVNRSQSEVPKGASILQILPKILIPGHM